MPRSKIGDVYEIQVLDKYAFLQDIRHMEHYGTLVRVFTTLYPSRLCGLDFTLSGPSFRLFYQIDAALKTPGLVRFIENRKLHDVDVAAVRFRQGRYIVEEGCLPRVVATLSAEEEGLPQFVNASQSSLLRRILIANGIDIPETELLGFEAKSIPSDHTILYLYFKTKRGASRCAAQIAATPMFTGFASHIQKSDTDWLLRLNGRSIQPIKKFLDVLEIIAAGCGGTLDGFEQPVSGGGCLKRDVGGAFFPQGVIIRG